MRLDPFRHLDWYGVFLPLNPTTWDAAEIAVWCRQTYGMPGFNFDDIDMRWRDQLYDGAVYFRDESDMELFVLKWA